MGSSHCNILSITKYAQLPMQYLPCFAAAGTRAQFLAMDRQNLVSPTPISPVMNMGTPEGRAHIIVHTVKFYQLLLAQDACYPRSVLMVGRDLVAESPLGFKRTLYVGISTGGGHLLCNAHPSSSCMI